LEKMITKRTVFLSCVGLAAISLGNPAIAAIDTNTPLAPAANNQMMSDVVPQTTCKLALIAQAERAEAYGQEKKIGRVYNVLGNSVYMQLDDGSTYVANLSMWERGKLGNIIGRRLVVTPYYCNRANLDTTLYFTPAKAIEVPPLTFSNSSPTTPPLTPRTEAPTPIQEAPVRETPREIIPQTW
jgi:hypothetical protein